ncbi:DUF1365 domain-containing protein [Vibrio gallicus]|uniref:DUF1365 domain-containing protein n=1 Tax=Vibrio gallicus TaxID=190897 RepID=UPI0021C2B899|nr:DUF1365 domain-containing protein [Vibrio gallicus]
MSSQIMCGDVRHRRFSPVKHQLNYALFMPCIDVDELESLKQQVWGFGDRWYHWARFKRSDYLGEGCLKKAVQGKVYELTGKQFNGRVEAVCHLRYLGFYFSPVNFYYVYDEQGVWRYLLAEVSNTPWNQRHYYALDADAGENRTNWRHQKAFHVSPFNPIDQVYQWRLARGERTLLVHLECHKQIKEFDATMALKGIEFNSKNMLRMLISTPIMTVKVIVGIYWHALKLFLKRAPFYPNPTKNNNQNLS